MRKPLWRPVLAVGAACALVLSFQSAAAAYVDVPSGSWYETYISACTQMGLMNGMLNNCFYPENPLTIAEGIAVAVRAYESIHPEAVQPALPAETDPSAEGAPEMEGTAETGAETPPGDAESPTEDAENAPQAVPDSGDQADGEVPWYQESLVLADQYGIYHPGEFTAGLETAIHRNQMAYLFANALGDDYAVLNQVSALPDVEASDLYSQQIFTLYRAGILSGRDAYGTFAPEEPVTRSEAAALLTRLVQPAARLTFTLQEEPDDLETILFGHSGEGRDLVAYRVGSGPNVMILDFALHGYEDHWAADGAELTYVAQCLQQTLEPQASRVTDLGWTVYLIPCANPDGVASGWTAYGPGRCTTTMLDSAGNLVYGQGIDLNRCFETGFHSRDAQRNHTGSQPLQAVEALALKQFVLEHQGSAKNIHIDTHGWTQQIIAGDPSGPLAQTLHQYFPRNAVEQLGGQGYFTAYTRSLGFDSCLFEFPQDVYSYQDLYNSGYIEKYIDAIWALLETY